MEMTEELFFKCINENAYFARDILILKETHKFKPIYTEGNISKLFAASQNRSIDIQPFYVSNMTGLSHVFTADPGVLTKDLFSTLNLYLDNNQAYFITINDPKISVTTAFSDIVPKIFFTLEKAEKAEITTLYIKVTSLI